MFLRSVHSHTLPEDSSALCGLPCDGSAILSDRIVTLLQIRHEKAFVQKWDLPEVLWFRRASITHSES